jgi:hypothetical protein
MSPFLLQFIHDTWDSPPQSSATSQSMTSWLRTFVLSLENVNGYSSHGLELVSFTLTFLSKSPKEEWLEHVSIC